MPAAGSGRRFGAPVPKQYLELAGRKVIEWALLPFIADPRCTGIVVALDPGDQHFSGLPLAREKKLRTVTGGQQRCDSVRHALSAVTGADDDWVLVHDAARPCLSRVDLDGLISTVVEDPVGGLLAAPLADTLKRADPGQRAVETPPRESLWRALTPQMFRLRVLRDALRDAHAGGRLPTDEAQAVEWSGHSALLVPGRADNLKITSPADLVLAAAVLEQGSNRK